MIRKSGIGVAKESVFSDIRQIKDGITLLNNEEEITLFLKTKCKEFIKL